MAPDPQTARIVKFPDLKPSTRNQILGVELGTQYDSMNRMFSTFGDGAVLDYGEWSSRDVSEMLSRDGQAAALESVLTLPIRQASRAIEPAKGDSGEAEFCNSVLFAPATSGGMTSLPANTPMSLLARVSNVPALNVVAILTQSRR